MRDPKWKQFELAVAEFLKRLAPGAEVTANAMRPDSDTGRPRQRDVWIEASVGGLIPVTILVSCKRNKRKLDQQQMDAFIGEWRSSRAHVGVVYSFSGFTKPALEKARAHGVSCCRLYEGDPPDIPEVLLFACYLWQSRVQVHVSDNLRSHPTLRWQDLFGITDADGSLLDQLEGAWQVVSDGAAKAIEEQRAKPNAVAVQRLEFAESTELSAFELKVTHEWRLFRARETGHSVSGSYSESDRAFIGSAMSPSIDTWSAEPGPGWEQVAEIRASDPNAVHLITVRPPVRQSLVDVLGPSRLFPDPAKGDEQLHET